MSDVRRADDPTPTARLFLDALTWGEHTTVWELLTPSARAAVVDLATRRGMDALLAARLREHTAGDDERDDFLADLLHGLRKTLRGVDIDTLTCVLGGSGTTVAGSVVVHLMTEAPPGIDPLPVGRIELVRGEDGRWAVVRLDGTP